MSQTMKQFYNFTNSKTNEQIGQTREKRMTITDMEVIVLALLQECLLPKEEEKCPWVTSNDEANMFCSFYDVHIIKLLLLFLLVDPHWNNKTVC